MEILISERERVAIFLVVDAGMTWGRSEKALLDRDEMYTALGLSEFEGMPHDTDELKSRDSELKQAQVSRDVAEHIIATVSAPELGMAREMARIIAPLVRRTRASLAQK